MFQDVFSLVFKIAFWLFIAGLIYSQFSHSRQYQHRQERRRLLREKRNKPKIKVNYNEHSKSNSRYCVYQINCSGMTYYGVTSNLEARMMSHLLNMNNETHDNYLLQREYDAGNISKDNFSLYKDNLTSQEAYNLEFELRPRPNMGWNLAAGGKH